MRLRRWRLWFLALMTATQKILLISHNLNFTQNTLGCYGLSDIWLGEG